MKSGLELFHCCIPLVSFDMEKSLNLHGNRTGSDSESSENAVFEGQRQLDVSFIVAAHIVHILDMNQVNGCGNGHILQDVVFSFQPDIECV